MLLRLGVDPLTSASADTQRELGELCFSGDWACADGNLGTLGYVARRIAARTAEPLRTKLLVLAEICREAPEHAVGVWLHLKDEVLGHGQYLPS